MYPTNVDIRLSGGLTPKVSCSYILRAMPPNGMVYFFELGQACVDYVTTIAAGFVLLSISYRCSTNYAELQQRY
jgi:hypothetical protein